MEFDKEQIEKSLPGYRFQEELGVGASGRVYLLTQLSTNRKIALKKINCFGMCDYERDNALNEVRILGSLQHDRIVKLESCLLDSQQYCIYILMEYADGGDLLRLIQNYHTKKKRVPEPLIWRVLTQISEGINFSKKALSYLHINKIIHRDIKPANIFKSGHSYKLGDLNVSKILKNTVAKTQIGSPYYTAPEVWLEESYDQKCDIWSLGLVIYQLCCGRLPFEANGIPELIRKLKSLKIGKIPTGYSYLLQEIIVKMLQKDSKKRLSADQILVICHKNGKMKQDRSLEKSSKQILMDTIQFPQRQNKWISPVPFPPKSSRKDMKSKEREVSRQGSRQKQNNNFFDNVSSIKVIENRSCILQNPSIPRMRSRKQNKSSDKEKDIMSSLLSLEHKDSSMSKCTEPDKKRTRIRLPSITKRSSICQIRENGSEIRNEGSEDNPQSKRSILRSISTARRKKNLFGQALKEAKKQNEKQITER